MRKVLFCTLLIFLVQGIWAQKDGFHSTRFGLKAGVNLLGLDFVRGSELSEGYTKTRGDVGWHAGFYIIAPISGSLYIQPEYLFFRMGGEVKPLNSNLNIDYFSFPVLVRWEMFRNLSFLAGPQFGLMIRAEAVNKEVRRDLINDIEHRHFGVVFQSELTVLAPISVAVRYFHGFSHVDLLYMEEKYELKYEMWQFSVAYTF